MMIRFVAVLLSVHVCVQLVYLITTLVRLLSSFYKASNGGVVFLDYFFILCIHSLSLSLSSFAPCIVMVHNQKMKTPTQSNTPTAR